MWECDFCNEDTMRRNMNDMCIKNRMFKFRLTEIQQHNYYHRVYIHNTNIGHICRKVDILSDPRLIKNMMSFLRIYCEIKFFT